MPPERAEIGVDGAASVVCLISPAPTEARIETFVRAHAERLPARVHLLFGGFFPYVEEGGPPLLRGPQRLAARGVASVVGATPRAVLKEMTIRGSDARRSRILARRLEGMGADVVLAEYGPTGVAVMGACERAGVPLVVMFHGYDAYADWILGGEGRRYPELFRRARGLVAVSRDMSEQLRSLGAPPERLTVNPCGVDLDRFRPQPEPGPPGFVFVGRFVDKKAPHLTVLAFERVRRSVPEARLVMIGDGPLREACIQLVRALGLEGSVELPGRRPHAEVAKAMEGARAVVQHSVRPTHGDSEGTPVAILEAGASGLPVVATRHAGIKDAVLDGETGLLVDEGDVEGMAERMIRLAEDPGLAARLGKAAREHIAAHYAMSGHIERLWGVLRAAMDGEAR